MVDADRDTVTSAAINVVTKNVDSNERLDLHRRGRMFRQKDMEPRINGSAAAAGVDDFGHGRVHVTKNDALRPRVRLA